MKELWASGAFENDPAKNGRAIGQCQLLDMLLEADHSVFLEGEE